MKFENWPGNQFQNSKYQDEVLKTCLKDVIIILISVFSVLCLEGLLNREQDFYLPFPSEDFKVLEGKLAGDSVKRGVSEYLYHISVEKVKSRKNITVFSDSKIRILSKGDNLLWGDYVEVENLVNIKDSFYKGSVRNAEKNEKKFFRIRRYIREIIEKKLKISGSENGLSLALITGSRNELISSDVLKFRRSGCSHLLALSGMHLGIISLFFYFIIKPVSGIRPALFIVNAINIIYLLISGFSPSLIRACILSIILSLTKSFKIKTPMNRALLLTFLVNIVLSPGSIRSLSFQYSYLALAGIVLYAKPFYRIILRYMPPFLSAPVACSLSAQLFTAPLSAYVFGEVFPSGIIASVFVTPVITLFMWSSLFPVILPSFQVIEPLFQLFRFINSLFADFIVGTVSLFSKFPCIRFNSFLFTVLILFDLSVIIIFTVPESGLKYFKRYR